jgi:hypothetical protein
MGETYIFAIATFARHPLLKPLLEKYNKNVIILKDNHVEHRFLH